MARRYDETLAVIEYADEMSCDFLSLGRDLTDVLEERGFEFNVIGLADDNEIQFISNGLILTLHSEATERRQLHLSAETPIEGSGFEDPAGLRVKAVRAVVRRVIATLPAQSVQMKHLGEWIPLAAHNKTASLDVRSAWRDSGVGQSSGDDDVEIFDRARRELRTLLTDPDVIDAEAAEAPDRTVQETVALYALSSTVAVINLPLGAALIAYNLVTGGTINAASRVLALTGAGIGMASLPAAAATNLGEMFPKAATLVAML